MAALTDAQIEQLQALLANQARISDLPEAEGKDVLSLIVEVLENGESKKTKLATLLPYLEDTCAYGVEWSTAVSTPAMTRVGNLSLHKSLPIQNRMKGVILADDGSVVEHLSPNSWKAHILDGSKGQVMVELPAHYRKFQTLSDGVTRRAMISEYPLPDYKFVPKQYVSAYEATVEQSTGKLCSIVNNGTSYRGGANKADWDGTYRSLLGRPRTSMSRTQFRNAARLRNTANTCWNTLTISAYKTIFWLYYIEYANRNCQLPYNAALDANGYKQGGLGNGISNKSAWGDFNSYNPFVPCGWTDDLGNFSGEVAYPIYDANGTLVETLYANRYRGIELPFSHIFKVVDGINLKVLSDADGGTTGLYECLNPANFSDSVYDGYTFQGNIARVNGYVNKLLFGENGSILPAETGGGSTTYWSDYFYCDKSVSRLMTAWFGGSAYGAGGGFAYAGTDLTPANAFADYGSRLCFIPV